MRCSSLFALGLIAPSLAQWQPLGRDEFTQALGKNEHILVAFVSTWQKYQNGLDGFQQEWNAAHGDEGKLVGIDCSATQHLCHEHDVVSFPTIRLYHPDGSFERYRGPRKSKDIGAYLKRMSRPVLSILDKNNASSFKSVDDVVFIANLDEGAQELEDRILDVARQYHDRYSFAIRRRKTHGVSLDCINNDNFEQVSLTDLSVPLAIPNLIHQCTRPLVPAFTRRNEGELSSMGKSMVHYLTSSDEDRESYVSAMRALAKKYKEYLVFVTTDVVEYPDLVTMTGHRAGSDGVLSVVNPKAGSVFPYRRQNITPETVEAFLSEISSGHVRPWDGTLDHAGSAPVERDEL